MDLLALLNDHRLLRRGCPLTNGMIVVELLGLGIYRCSTSMMGMMLNNMRKEYIRIDHQAFDALLLIVDALRLVKPKP